MEAVSNASEDLYVNISKTLGFLNELTEISKDKEAFLTAGDIEGLRGATEKEEDIIVALNKTEKDRKICADALSKAIGLFTKEAALSDIIAHIEDTAMKQRLTDIRHALVMATDKLSAQNEKLGQLLQVQIGFTDYMINLMCIPKKSNHSYDIQGSRREEHSSLSLLDLHI